MYLLSVKSIGPISRRHSSAPAQCPTNPGLSGILQQDKEYLIVQPFAALLVRLNLCHRDQSRQQ